MKVSDNFFQLLNLQFCNLSAGTYYAKLSFQTTTQEYSIEAKFDSEILGDKKNNPITINTTGNFEHKASVLTKCLTLDSAENTFSADYGKSFWTKITVPTAYYGNPIKIALNAGTGYNNTNGKTLVRMFDNNGNMVQNNVHLDMVTSHQVNLEATYCSIKAGAYWIQVLLEDAADFVVNLSISGDITTTHNQYTLGSPKDFGVSDNQSLTFEDYLACSKPPIGTYPCALPKCSTFLRWTINSPQILSVRINPENNPDSLKFIVWKKDVLPCQYISFLTSCGNSTAVLDAGTYMMQVYTNAPLQNPLLAMLSVTLSSPATSEGDFTSIGFTSVDIGDENLTIGRLIFDATPTFVSPSTSHGLPNNTNPTPLTNFGLACEETTNNPSSPTEVRAVGFELLQESFVKLIYDTHFKTKLYRAESLADLVESNLVYGCGDSTYFCSLQPDKYILVLYSVFLNTTKTVKISAWKNGVSNAPSLALAPNNDFGANPQNSIKTDKIYCTTQRNENDNLPTTNASRYVWFTWKTTQAGNFTINGGNYQYGDDGLRFYLYYTDQEDFITSNLVYLNEYNVNHHTFTSPCQNRRYYLKAVGKPNQTVSLKVNFVPNLNTQQGNYMSNAYALNFATTGSFTSVTYDISCHDLSPATDYKEGDNTDAFTQGISNFKSTWFKIHNTVPYNINMELRLQHNLSNFGFVRYRILKANSTGTNIISEGTTVTNTNSIINLECFNDAYYYVQVLTNRESTRNAYFASYRKQ